LLIEALYTVERASLILRAVKYIVSGLPSAMIGCSRCSFSPGVSSTVPLPSRPTR
jgi:hypothetical protein